MNIRKAIVRNTLWLSRLWYGEVPLVKAFWLYGVLVFFGALGLITALGDASDRRWDDLAIDLMYAILCIELLYAIIWSVGVWRSSSKYGGPLVWRYLVYATVVTEVIGIINNLMVLGFIGARLLNSK